MPPNLSASALNRPITIADSPAIDAFDRLRVSNPVGLFDSTLNYDKQPLLWDEALTGGATSTHVPDEAAVDLAVTSSGDKVVRRTFEYFRYQPGKSQLIFMTFNLNAGDANVRKRVGYFDDENGLFLEEIDGALWIVLRSNATGTPVDTRIAQADWSLDIFGSLDPEKTQILVMDLEWLGVGRVRVGFVTDGIIVYAHEFLNANVRTTVYMSTAQLPLCYEIEATGAPAGAITFSGICGACISEGGQEVELGFPFGVRSSALKAVSGTRIPLLSIRPKATFNGITNRVKILPDAVSVFNNSNLVILDVLFNPTLTGAAWVSADSSSVVEYDVTATSLTGGILLGSGFAGATNQSKGGSDKGILGRVPLALDLAGNPTIITIAATNLGGNGSCLASINWQEYR